MTQVEICNRAMAVLGHDRTIASMTEGTAEAVRCSMFWNAARDSVLSAFVWEFATATLEVAKDTETAIPSDCLRIVDLKDESGNPVTPVRTPGKITVPVKAYLRYVSNAVAVDKWPNAVADAVVHELAFRLYAPMLGNPNTQESVAAQQSFSALAKGKLDEAKEIELEEHAYLGVMHDPEALAKTDVANRALALVGCPRTIRSFDEDPSAEAVRCRQLLPMAVKRVLSAHDWEFAQRTESVAGREWTRPADYLRLVSARNDEGRVVNATLSGNKIVFDTDGTYGVRYVTSDIGMDHLPTYVSDAVVFQLAAYLVPSFVDKEGGAQQAQAIVREAEAALAKAVESELEERAWRGEPADDTTGKLDIVNRALAMIGSSVTVKDFDGDTTPVAVRARQLLPVCLAKTLRHRDWDFAAVEVPLTLTPADANGFARMYPPEDCARLSSCTDERGNPLECRRAKDFWYVRTDGRRVIVRYVSKDIDLAEAPDEFADILTAELAARLAPTVLTGVKNAAATVQLLEDKARRAFAAESFTESNETANPGEWENPLISCRR